MKIILLPLMALFFLDAQAQVDVEVLCYTSGGDKPIRFEMRSYYDSSSKWNGGFVKYEKSKTPISIVQIDFQGKTTEQDSPSETTVSWIEFNKDQISGRYERVSQGVNVSSMTYIKKGNGKIFSFFLDNGIDRSIEKGCAWAKP